MASRRTPPRGTQHRRRAVNDFSGSQTGDVSSHDAAGRDFYGGANADKLLEFIRDYVFEDRQSRDVFRIHLQGRIDRMEDEVAFVILTTQKSITRLQVAINHLVFAVVAVAVVAALNIAVLLYLVYLQALA